MNYENEELCASCEGKCCKTISGAADPDDIVRNFGEPLTLAVEKALLSGNWVVDWWEGDPRNEFSRDNLGAVNRGYYLRPRITSDQGNFCPSWGNSRCLFLAEAGCKLEMDLRPVQCRSLEPVAGGDCILHSGGRKQEVAITWLPHHDAILKFE